MGCLALSYYEQRLPIKTGRSIFLSTAKAAQRCPQGIEKKCAGSYKFGFNGQEKVNEIAGMGNHTTALFWEYDTRIARRWNLDPVVTPSVSLYSVMEGNPILKNDPLGNVPGDYYDSKTGKYLYNDGKNDGRVYVRTTSKTTVSSYGMPVTKESYSYKYIGQKDRIPDKTDVFNNTLSNTAAVFSRKSYSYNKKHQYDSPYNFAEGKLKLFKSLVTDHSPYDIKNQPGSPFYAGPGNKNFTSDHAFYEGRLLRYDDFGNYNYGVAAKAFGIGRALSEFGAGLNQMSKPNVPHGGLSTYGDDPKDNYMINLGYDHIKNHKKGIGLR